MKIFFLCVIPLFALIILTPLQADGDSGNVIQAKFSYRGALWTEAQRVDFASQDGAGTVSVVLSYEPVVKALYASFIVTNDVTADSNDRFVLQLDLGNERNTIPDSNDWYFLVTRSGGWGDGQYDLTTKTWTSAADYPSQWPYVVLSTSFGWSGTLAIPITLSDNQTLGILLAQRDGTGPYAYYPLGSPNDDPSKWSKLMVSMRDSSISLAVSASTFQLNEEITFTATTTPTTQNGTVTLQYSKDGKIWTDFANGKPLNGGYTTTWTPVSTASSYQFKATWSGDDVYRKSSTILTYNYLSINSAYGSIKGDGWYISGAKTDFSVSPNIVEHGNGTRRIFLGWSGDYSSDSTRGSITMDNPRRITANWKTQYRVTVKSAYGSPVGEDWYDARTIASFSVSTPIDYGNQTRRVFTGWSGDSASKDPVSSITVDSPKTLNAIWKKQNYLTVKSAYGEATGTGWYDTGSSATFSASTTLDHGNRTRRVFTGWTGDSSSTTPQASITIDSPKLVVAGWKTQYDLAVNSIYGKTDGAGWYDAGSTVSFSIVSTVDHGNKTRRVFTRWTGDSSGTSSSTTITMNSPKTVAAEWKTQYLLTVDQNGGEATGEAWHDRGTTATATATSPSKTVENRSRLVFIGWSADSSSTATTVQVDMNMPHLLTANWKTQYYVKIDVGTGVVDKASQWIDSGSTLAIAAASPSKNAANKSRIVFTGWSGDLTSTETAITVRGDTYKTLKANWKNQYYLRVVSPTGDPQGEGWYDEGATASFSVKSPLGILIQQVFTGWSGDSSAAASSASLTMNSAKTVIAKWTTEYTQIIALVGTVASISGVSAFLLRRKK